MHRPVLDHMIGLRIAAAAELDRTLLAAAEAQAAYDDTTYVISLAMQRGARHPGGPHLARGPYGKRPGEHEAAERLAWGRPSDRENVRFGHLCMGLLSPAVW